MRTLVIDCATEACSVALFADEGLLAHWHALIGRGHAEQLVPAIAALPEKGCASRILVSLGPGSFTGVRIGLAAARALGLAWGAEVLGYPTLGLIAAMARKECGAEPVTVCTSGGHGEWFVQHFGPDGLAEGALASLTPAVAASQPAHRIVAGSKAPALAGPDALVMDVLPDARFALLLPPALLVGDLAPLYGRPPDARPAEPRPQAVPLP